MIDPNDKSNTSSPMSHILCLKLFLKAGDDEKRAMMQEHNL